MVFDGVANMGSENFSNRATSGTHVSPRLRQMLSIAGWIGVFSSGLFISLPAIAEDESPVVETSAESLLSPQPSSTIAAPEPVAPAPQPAYAPEPAPTVE